MSDALPRIVISWALQVAILGSANVTTSAIWLVFKKGNDLDLVNPNYITESDLLDYGQ